MQSLCRVSAGSETVRVLPTLAYLTAKMRLPGHFSNDFALPRPHPISGSTEASTRRTRLVISRDRLPTYDDKPRLPYIEAMSKELLRWHMVTPLGRPHGFPALITSPVTID
jgi:hypothetical protein